MLVLSAKVPLAVRFWMRAGGKYLTFHELEEADLITGDIMDEHLLTRRIWPQR